MPVPPATDGGEGEAMAERSLQISPASIQIKIGALELTCHGPLDRDLLDGVLESLRSQLPELMAAGDKPGEYPSAAELLAQSDATTFGEKAGVAAWWLEEYRGRPSWRSGDIVDVLREAEEQVPANITDALNQKAKKGLFEVRDRRWRLTGEGRGWVKYRLLNLDEDDR